MVKHGLCGTAAALLSSENSCVLLLDMELQADGKDSKGPQSGSHPQSHK